MFSRLSWFLFRSRCILVSVTRVLRIGPRETDLLRHTPLSCGPHPGQNRDVVGHADECGVEGDPRPRQRWAQRDAKAIVTRNGDHLRMNVCRAVCPRTGEFYALEFSHSNRAAFQAFLVHASSDLRFARGRNILVVDNASWHKSKALDWGAFEPLFLPPYSPDFDPIEKLWMLIKAEFFNDFIARNRDQLIERLDTALIWAMARSDKNTKTCSIRKKL